MKALTLLLGARAIDIAQYTRRRTPGEIDLLPIASTPEQRGAWARWAAADRTEAAQAARPQYRGGRPAADTRPA